MWIARAQPEPSSVSMMNQYLCGRTQIGAFAVNRYLPDAVDTSAPQALQCGAVLTYLVGNPKPWRSSDQLGIFTMYHSARAGVPHEVSHSAETDPTLAARCPFPRDGAKTDWTQDKGARRSSGTV